MGSGDARHIFQAMSKHEPEGEEMSENADTGKMKPNIEHISDRKSCMSTYYIQEQNIALYARQILLMELLTNKARHGDDSERAEAFLEVSHEVTPQKKQILFFKGMINNHIVHFNCAFHSNVLIKRCMATS